MDMATIESVVAEIGEAKIAGFIFDNSARKFFRKGKFKMADVKSTGGNMLRFEEIDPMGVKYFVYKHPENVQAIISTETEDDLDKLDHRYLG